MTKIYTYNGQVIRKSTSATKNYRYALVTEELAAVTCSASYDRCLNELNSLKRSYQDRAAIYRKRAHGEITGNDYVDRLSPGLAGQEYMKAMHQLERYDQFQIVELEVTVK